MSVTIRGGLGERILVTGDIERELKIPYDPEDARFLIAFSDGTLVRGHYDEERIYTFKVVVEGAGIACIALEGEHDVLTLDWRIDWVTVSQWQNGIDATPEEREQLAAWCAHFGVANG